MVRVSYTKQFSILGDSISTLDGYNPRGYNVFYKEDNCEKSGVKQMSDTWWGKVIDFFGGELLVNNSWSGSRVTKLPRKDSLFPSGCSDERTSALHINNVKPDVIIVYLGTNDWAYGVKTGNDTGILGEDDREKFDFAYRRMIEKLKSNYPDSEILCCTLNKTFMSQKPSFVFPEKHGGIHIEEYNEIIRRIAHDMHCKLIDLYSYNVPYDTIDGSHPNAAGMNTLATLMIREIGGEEINKFLDCSAPLENYDDTLMLTVKNTEEKLRCRKNVVRVGRERAYVDICFSNQEISRFQANFIYKNNRWFLCDTKSINGTWLNGKRIEPQKEYELCANDVINFANAIEVIFNEITSLYLYDAKHEFVVADEYTGGTKYVCKKCGKVKYESTLLFDYKILNVHISYDADGNYGKSIDLDGSKLMWRNTMRSGPVTDIDLSEKVKVLNRLELSSLIDKILAVNFDSCVTDASLDYPTGASYNVFTCIYNDGKKFEYKTRFKPAPAFMLLVDIFEKYCVEPDVGIQNHTSGTFYNGATVELDADNSTVDNEDCFDLLQPYFVGKVLYERYSVLKQIHGGAWFKIYLVEDIKTNKKWTMKVCDKKQKGYNDNIHEIIMQEPKMMMKFDHPAMPRVLDIIEDDRYISIIRDYFEGEPLNIVVQKKGPLPVEKVVEWGKKLCGALSYLHNLTPSHIHRDVKPHNIILTPDGKLKLIDFGIMRLYDPKKSRDTTFLGTKGYAAPEQFVGQTDARTDIFGLGMTLCELVTGEDPKKREYVHRPIRQINPDLPKGLEYIISKCTEVDPKNRYQTCSELMDDLNNYMSLPKSKGFFGKFFGKK